MSTASPAAPAASASRARPRFDPKSLSGFVLPLYFVLLLAATIVTATHHQQPHDMALTIAGPDASTAQIAAGLDSKSPGAFDVTRVTDPDGVREAVATRQAVGAIVVGGTASSPTVTTYLSGGSGRSASATVQATGAAVAQSLGATAKVVDVAPLVPDDELGTGFFYIVLYSGIGGYLTLIVLTQVMPRARLRTKYGVALGAAVVAPIVVVGLSSIFIDFQLSFGALMAVLGIDALYVLTVALVVVLAEQLIGRAAIFLVAPLAIFANISASGGPAPESMLPGFWQALHSFWFGAGATEAIRDVIYFPAANPVRWIVQLLVWPIALIVLTLLIESGKQIWRLQSVLIRQAHHTESLQEHLRLLSVMTPRSEALPAIASERPTPDPADQPRPDGPAPDREPAEDRTATEPVAG